MGKNAFGLETQSELFFGATVLYSLDLPASQIMGAHLSNQSLSID